MDFSAEIPTLKLFSQETEVLEVFILYHKYRIDET